MYPTATHTREQAVELLGEENVKIVENTSNDLYQDNDDFALWGTDKKIFYAGRKFYSVEMQNGFNVNDVDDEDSDLDITEIYDKYAKLLGFEIIEVDIPEHGEFENKDDWENDIKKFKQKLKETKTLDDLKSVLDEHEIFYNDFDYDDIPQFFDDDEWFVESVYSQDEHRVLCGSPMCESWEIKNKADLDKSLM